MTIVPATHPPADNDDNNDDDEDSFDEQDQVPLSKLVPQVDPTSDDTPKQQGEPPPSGNGLGPDQETKDPSFAEETDTVASGTKSGDPTGTQAESPSKESVEEGSEHPKEGDDGVSSAEGTPPESGDKAPSMPSDEGQASQQRRIVGTLGGGDNVLLPTPIQNENGEPSKQPEVDILTTPKGISENAESGPTMDVDPLVHVASEDKAMAPMEEEIQNDPDPKIVEPLSTSDDPPSMTDNGVRRERPKAEHSSPEEVPAPSESMPETSTAMEVDVNDTAVDEVIDFILPPAPPPRIVSSCEEDEGGGVFETFRASPLSKTKKKSSKKRPVQVKISIPMSFDENEDEKKDEAGDTIPNPLSLFRRDIVHVSVQEQLAQVEAELEDSLSFFRDSHEDQDPAFVAFINAQKRKQIEAELKALDLEDEDGRKEIEAVINSQIRSKRASTDDQFERYKAKKNAEEKQAMAKLQTMFNDKVASNQVKINQGIDVLKQRHSTEGQRFLEQHRQQAAQRNLPEHMASEEWANLQQQLSSKHKRQVEEFMGKGEDVKKRTETEYRREMAKIRSQYEKQVQDVENNRRTIYQKIFAGYQQSRQRYIKRHHQKIMKKREVLTKALGENDPSGVVVPESHERSKVSTKSSKQESQALQPPSPIKSSGDGFDTFPYAKSGAAARHKFRKGVLSQISKQLSVEIHNEGVWMAVLQEKKDEKKKEQPSDPHTESDQKLFLPWGIKSRDFLESIICGEIPSVLESGDFDFGDSVSMNGGHLRCVLTDLRTSDETARMQRVQAVRELPNIETASLEQKALELQTAYNNADKIHAKFEKEEKDIIPQVKEAMKDYEDKKQHWENFRSKFAKYLGADGNPLPQTNPSDRQKLTQAIARYRGNVENAEKQASAAQMKLRRLKEEVHKYANLKKQTHGAAVMAAAAIKKQKSTVSSGSSFSQVRDAISALELTADKRREQLNHKRTNSTSSTWVQNLPGVPGPLRRSLWHKMHRRRQQIVLRPSQQTVTADLHVAVVNRLSKIEGTNSQPDKLLELQKAEQAFLLATHPLPPCGEKMSSAPSSSSPWGEPGWHLVLDVPKPSSGTILPRAIGAPIVEKNLSEINSAPGRQASSLLRSTQIRSLEAPLSAISTVTSLAETNPGVAMSTQPRHVENDPMNPTEQQFEDGYAFNAKLIVPNRPAAPVRRKSLSSGDSPAASANVRTNVSTSASGASTKPAPGEQSAAGSPSKTSKKRKPVADTATKPAQRRKPAPSKPTAAQAKALHAQQQKQRQALAAAAAVQRQQQKAQQQVQQLQQHQHLQPQTQQHLQPQAQHLQPQTQHLQPQTQHLQPQTQHLQPQIQQKPQQQQTMGHSHYQRQPSMNVMDRSQNSYGQFMQPMAAPPNQPSSQNYQQQLYHQQQQVVQQRQVPQQQQFQPQQIAQLRMMQQQQQQQAPSQQVQYNQSPHGMQPMSQFFQPMQQSFSPTPIGMPGQVVGQPGMSMNLQGNNNTRQNPANGDDSNDPLFMLK